MNIAIILPGELPGETGAAVKAGLQRIVSPATQTRVYAVKGATIQVATDIDRLTPAAVEKTAEAEQNGCDALVLNGA